MQSCDKVNDISLSPEIWERPSYKKRIDSSNDLIVKPLDIICATKAFSQAAAERWAIKGDPVAIYILLYDKFHGQDQRVCKNYKYFQNLLDVGHQAPSYMPPHSSSVVLHSIVGDVNIKIGRVLHRVPEFYIISNNIKALCMGADHGDFNPFDAASHGYNPLPLSPPFGPR